MNLEDMKSMLMEAPVGFAVVAGSKWRFLLANRPYLEMVGRTDVTGKTWAEVFPELVGTATEAVVRSVYEGRTVSVTEFPVPLNRGGKPSDGFFTFTLQPIKSGGGVTTGFMVIAVEVTELVNRRRDAEALAERLRLSEERFRGAQETSPDAFLSLRNIRDGSGRVVDFEILFQNDAAQRINGITVTPGLRMLQAFPSLPQSELWPRYLRTAESGEPFVIESPYRYDGIDGTFRIACSRVGEGVAVSFSDISEQVRLKAAERQAREQAEFLAADVLRQSRETEKALVEHRAARLAAEARVAELEKRLGT